MNKSIMTIAAVVMAMALLPSCSNESDDSVQKNDAKTLRIAVMDPLSSRLACVCVEGYAQRNYEELGQFLARKLDRNVRVDYGESLMSFFRKNPQPIDLVIGKESTVIYDADKCKVKISKIARLSDRNGETNLKGLLIVRNGDSATKVEDVKGYRIMLGPKHATEKSRAAEIMFTKHGVLTAKDLKRASTCSTAALAVFENLVDAAVISDYAMPLLEGCGAIDKGQLRVIGQTEGVPFITVFATEIVTEPFRRKIVEVLSSVKDNRDLLKALESKSGFTAVAEK